jgi:acyl-CoA synthetase (AMP-forming)/AMP-acid ligase II
MSDAIGTILVLSGCFLAASGYALQKRGNTQNDAQLAALRKPLWRNASWLAGLGCMIISALLVVASAPFLDQSKSAPLGAATLVFNTLLSSVVLGESFLVLHLISTVLIIVGSVTSSLANAAPSQDLSFAQITALFDGVALAFFIACALLAAGSVWTLRRISRAPRAEWSARDATTLSLLAALTTGARLVSSPHFDAGEALVTMWSEECTHTSGNDTMFLMLLNHPDFDKYPLKLRHGWVSCGPEVSRKVVERMGMKGNPYAAARSC